MRFPGAFLLIVAPQQEHDCVRPLGACGRGRGRGGLGMWWNGEGGCSETMLVSREKNWRENAGQKEKYVQHRPAGILYLFQ